MNEQQQQPKNIFEQMMYAIKAVNDNVVVLSENLGVVLTRLDALNLAPVEFPEQCASACGDGTAEEGGDGQEQEA